MPAPPTIGVGITTRNRRAIFDDSLSHWLEVIGDARLVVVDDGSDTPVPAIDGATVIRHGTSRGVAQSKNRCIAALLDAGCDHLFLADDDVYPRVPWWWRPYVESPEHHLCYQWPRPARRVGGGRLNRWRLVPQPGHPLAETHFAVGFPRGVLIYLDRRVVDTVGGFDPEYGRGEHVEFSYRCWLAGLSTFSQRDESGAVVAAYGDVRGSEVIWYARDRYERIQSTFGDREAMRQADIDGARRWGVNWPGGVPVRIDPWTGTRTTATCLASGRHR